MTILALDSSSRTASVCVWRDGKILSLAYADSGYTHSRTLMPTVDFALNTAGVALADADLLAAAAGPGSFTGLRIGVATVKGLAFAADKPCAAVSTLEALACSHRGWDGVICAALDARRGQVYAALFTCENGKVMRLTEDGALSAEDVTEQIRKITGRVLLVGDGAELIRGADNAVPAPLENRFIAAPGVALAASSMTPVSAGELLPVYHRKPQAEREREDKTRG